MWPSGPKCGAALAELDGQGEVAGGIIVMRYGENAPRGHRGCEEETGGPEGRASAGCKDRAGVRPLGLIDRAIDNLTRQTDRRNSDRRACLHDLSFPRQSALVAVFTLPTAILMAFIVMQLQGLNANIMSLGGIAIAIGAMVDAAIIMIENAHKHIEAENAKPPEERLPHWQVILQASKEVGPPLFWSLLVITVSFIPIFTLEAQEGRLFKPLAFTKTYSMAAAAILAVTIVPVLMGYFVRGQNQAGTRQSDQPLPHFGLPSGCRRLS